jgi:hypothetical protein
MTTVTAHARYVATAGAEGDWADVGNCLPKLLARLSLPADDVVVRSGDRLVAVVLSAGWGCSFGFTAAGARVLLFEG